MESIALLSMIFGGTFVITNIINIIRFEFWLRWPRGDHWLLAAKKEGWLRKGQLSNLAASLIGTIIFSLGFYSWGWSNIGTRGQDFIFVISGLAFLFGMMMLSAQDIVEDIYNMTPRTLRWGGLVGMITAAILYFNSQ